MRYTLSLAVVIAACSSSPALAQAPEPPTSSTRNQTVSVNPFFMLFEWYSAEFERKVSPGVSIGLSAATLDDAFWDAEVFARFYPQGNALNGFYLGARGGVVGIEVTRYTYQPYQPPPPGTPPGRGVPNYPIATRETRSIPAFGLEAGYNWLLGSRKNIAIGVGFGLSRLLDDDNGDYFMPPVVPHFRLVNVGVAF